MAVTRRIPWRKLKTLGIVCFLIGVVHVIWTMSGITSRMSHSNDSGSLRFIPNGQFLPQFVRSKNVCKKVVPFQTSPGGVVSTYDLPKETDYTLDKNGRYKIPQEFYEKEKTPLKHETTVILVPFSHADPGYGMTFEQYYSMRIKHALNNMVEHLWQYQNMTFQWAEVVFLERWFRDITPETKTRVRELIKRGQLEIVLGGWVMPDEASTHYAPVVDQLIEGHQWIKNELGIHVVNAWINDPFGYSSTMPYLWKKSGIENMVILRMHQAIKATLMRKRIMDFKWRPYWNSDSDVNDILCNIMPYPGYWNSDVCGPDQAICKQFNFLHMRSSVDSKPVTDQNVADLAEKLYKAYKFTASLYKYKSLIIFLGEDNSYDEQGSFSDTNFNYGKLIKYINEKKDWNMSIRFGTIADYFKNVKEVERAATSDTDVGGPFPLLSGDFFPYSDFENDTWTGYYTTRMWMKRFVREIEPVLRMADAFSVLAYQYCVREKQCADISGAFKQVLSDLRSARRDVGIFQHHDGITGTSLPSVVSDYEFRLTGAFAKTQKSLATLLSSILTKGKATTSSALLDSMVKTSAQSILSHRAFIMKDGMKIVIANALVRPRKDVVSFFVDKPDKELIDDKGMAIPYQVSSSGDPKYAGFKKITVRVDLLPYEIKVLTVRTGADSSKASPADESEYSQTTGSENSGPLTIENRNMKIEVNSKTGVLQRITDKDGKDTKMELLFLKYSPQKSGAYLFGPKGPAEPLTELFGSPPKIKVIKGTLFSQVVVNHDCGFSQTLTLYHVEGVKASGLHITNEINLSRVHSFTNTEIVMRFHTDIDNENIFFTDQNGFQLMGRRNDPSRPIESNYYPITTTAVLEDKNKRLTLHSAQSHGVASLSSGCLEVMLDRNVLHDDRKGLGMGVQERVLTLTEFVIEIQHKTTPEPIAEERYTYPSINSMLLNEQLQSKTQVLTVEADPSSFEHKFTPAVPHFPCDLSIVGMRFLLREDSIDNDISLVMHRKPVHCSSQTSTTESCSVKDEPFTAAEFMEMFGVSGSSISENIRETSLTHVKDVASVAPTTDLRPEASELRSFFITLKSDPSENNVN